MKIDNSIKTVPNSGVNETRSRTPGKSTALSETANSNNVRLSGLSAQLQSTDEAPAFNAARVAQIKQAIAEGSFKINSGAIAERLIASSKELINSQRQG